MSIDEISQRIKENSESELKNLIKNIISKLSSNRTQFIYELLQNAEDTKAKNVGFHLNRDGIIFFHDGNIFDENDIEKIVRVGDSAKVDCNDKIGKFGIGFKSVYEYTKSPSIYSKDKSHDVYFEIIDFRDPKEITSIPDNILGIQKSIEGKDENKSTIFNLPFDSDEYFDNKEKAYEQIKNSFLELKEDSILFLKYIENIIIEIDDEKINIRKCEEPNGKIKIKRISNQNNREDESKEYLLFEKLTSYEGNEKYVKIAYEMNKEKIIPNENSNFFVFFPTAIGTGLKMLIHAPFNTTPARDNIKDDKELYSSESSNNDIEHSKNMKSYNSILYDALTDCFFESLEKLRDDKLISMEFLREFIPYSYNYNSNPLYKRINSKLDEEFKNKELIPTNDGNYEKCIKIAILEESDTELSNLFKNEDINLKWISNDAYEYKYDYNFNYWIKKICENNIFRIKDCIKLIDDKFVKSRGKEWLINFLKFMSNKTDCESLKNKPIILLENGIYIEPFKNNKPNVYLNNPDGYEKIHEYVLEEIKKENSKIQTFFKKLGLKKYDLREVIKNEILPKYKDVNNNISLEENIKDLLKIKQVDINIDNYFIFRSSNDDYCKPTEIYVTSEIAKEMHKDKIRKLEHYFEGIEGIKYISSEYLKCKELDYDFFVRNGGNTEVKYLTLEDKQKEREITDAKERMKKYLRNYCGSDCKRCNGETQSSKFYNIDSEPKDLNPYLTLDKLDQVIKNIDFNKSLTIFQSIGYNVKLNGKIIQWRRYRERSPECSRSTFVLINTMLLDILISSKWIYDNNEKGPYRPSEITVGEIHKKYKEINVNSPIFNLLNFKYDRTIMLTSEQKKALSIGENILNNPINTAKSILKNENPKLVELIEISEREDISLDEITKLVMLSLRSNNTKIKGKSLYKSNSSFGDKTNSCDNYEEDEDDIYEVDENENYEATIYREKVATEQMKNSQNTRNKEIVRTTICKAKRCNSTQIKQFLKNEYEGRCQICGTDSEFERPNSQGKYFETVYWPYSWNNNREEWLKNASWITAEGRVNGDALCLCPTCAAKLKYGEVSFDEADLINQIDDSRKFKIKLCGKLININYSIRHFVEIKAVLKAVEEQKKIEEAGI